MVKKIKSRLIGDENKNKNKNHNIKQNLNFSSKSEGKNKQTNFLGKKRIYSYEQKVLSISKPKTHCINRANINDISKCQICHKIINLRDRLTCYNGHIMHRACIFSWINSEKNECQKIKDFDSKYEK